MRHIKTLEQIRAEAAEHAKVLERSWHRPTAVKAPPPPPPAIHEGPERYHLYFISNPLTGAIKIGVSYSVKERLHQMEYGCGMRLDLLGVLRHGGAYEIPLHLAFDHDRLLGEWFRSSAELLAIARQPAGVQPFLETVADWIAEGRIRRAERIRARRAAR